jgi:hypothetical protein
MWIPVIQSTPLSGTKASILYGPRRPERTPEPRAFLYRACQDRYAVARDISRGLERFLEIG